uniref:Transglutaminase N-terminal domain-containing protein n=1 Tax=Amazona collaria TaxID=241587 RepID=A0A8B9FPT5_9PSIT
MKCVLQCAAHPSCIFCFQDNKIKIITDPKFSLFPLAGPSPAESQQTKATFNLSEEGASGWSSTQELSEPGCMNFITFSPANAVNGQYQLKLQIVSGNKSSATLLGQFMLLFNPWCPSMF